AHDPRARDPEADALQVPLGEVGSGLQDPLVRRAARPVHLVVDPRREPEPVRLLHGQRDAVEIGVADVWHLEPETPVEHDALHPLVAQLTELEAHLLGVELAVQEPEREDAVVARWFSERVEVHRSRGQGITVAFTNPGGFSTAVLTALSVWSSGTRSVATASVAILPEVRRRI